MNFLALKEEFPDNGRGIPCPFAKLSATTVAGKLRAHWMGDKINGAHNKGFTRTTDQRPATQAAGIPAALPSVPGSNRSSPPQPDSSINIIAGHIHSTAFFPNRPRMTPLAQNILNLLIIFLISSKISITNANDRTATPRQTIKNSASIENFL